MIKKNMKVAPSVTEKQKKVEIVYNPYFESTRLPQSRQCIYQVFYPSLFYCSTKIVFIFLF